MVSTLVIDQSTATLLARISFRAAEVEHLTQAEPRPSLKVLVSPTRISADLHPPTPARVSRSFSLPTEMSIPVTVSSAVSIGDAAFTVAGFKDCVSLAASAGALSFSLSPETSRMKAIRMEPLPP